MEEKSNVALIREFFESEPYGRKVTMEELKMLTKEDREELGAMIRNYKG